MAAFRVALAAVLAGQGRRQADDAVLEKTND